MQGPTFSPELTKGQEEAVSSPQAMWLPSAGAILPPEDNGAVTGIYGVWPKDITVGVSLIYTGGGSHCQCRPWYTRGRMLMVT